MTRLVGRGVSAGLASGEALILDERSLDVRYRISDDAVAAELTGLATASALSRDQLRALRLKVARAGSEHASLFDAQLFMLDDPLLIGKARSLVQERRINASWALLIAEEDLARRFGDIEDPDLRERTDDVADVVGRMRMNLRDGRQRIESLLPDRDGPFILVAEELSASVAVQLDWDRVVAFVLAAGSWTYYTAILARSLGIPAVVALRDVTTMIEPGVRVVVDGSSGDVLVNPPVELRTEMMADEPTVRQSAAVTRGVHRIHTADGRVVRLEANIERPEDVEAARSNGATGIGLYCSEYLVAERAVEAVSERMFSWTPIAASSSRCVGFR